MKINKKRTNLAFKKWLNTLSQERQKLSLNNMYKTFKRAGKEEQFVKCVKQLTYNWHVPVKSMTQDELFLYCRHSFVPQSVSSLSSGVSKVDRWKKLDDSASVGNTQGVSQNYVFTLKSEDKIESNEGFGVPDLPFHEIGIQHNGKYSGLFIDKKGNKNISQISQYSSNVMVENNFLTPVPEQTANISEPNVTLRSDNENNFFKPVPEQTADLSEYKVTLSSDTENNCSTPMFQQTANLSEYNFTLRSDNENNLLIPVPVKTANLSECKETFGSNNKNNLTPVLHQTVNPSKYKVTLGSNNENNLSTPVPKQTTKISEYKVNLGSDNENKNKCINELNINSINCLNSNFEFSFDNQNLTSLAQKCTVHMHFSVAEKNIDFELSTYNKYSKSLNVQDKQPENSLFKDIIQIKRCKKKIKSTNLVQFNNNKKVFTNVVKGIENMMVRKKLYNQNEGTNPIASQNVKQLRTININNIKISVDPIILKQVNTLLQSPETVIEMKRENVYLDQSRRIKNNNIIIGLPETCTNKILFIRSYNCPIECNSSVNINHRDSRSKYKKNCIIINISSDDNSDDMACKTVGNVIYNFLINRQITSVKLYETSNERKNIFFLITDNNNYVYDENTNVHIKKMSLFTEKNHTSATENVVCKVTSENITMKKNDNVTSKYENLLSNEEKDLVKQWWVSYYNIFLEEKVNSYIYDPLDKPDYEDEHWSGTFHKTDINKIMTNQISNEEKILKAPFIIVKGSCELLSEKEINIPKKIQPYTQKLIITKLSCINKKLLSSSFSSLDITRLIKNVELKLRMLNPVILSLSPSLVLSSVLQGLPPPLPSSPLSLPVSLLQTLPLSLKLQNISLTLSQKEAPLQEQLSGSDIKKYKYIKGANLVSSVKEKKEPTYLKYYSSNLNTSGNTVSKNNSSKIKLNPLKKICNKHRLFFFQKDTMRKTSFSRTILLSANKIGKYGVLRKNHFIQFNNFSFISKNHLNKPFSSSIKNVYDLLNITPLNMNIFASNEENGRQLQLKIKCNNSSFNQILKTYSSINQDHEVTLRSKKCIIKVNYKQSSNNIHQIIFSGVFPTVKNIKNHLKEEIKTINNMDRSLKNNNTPKRSSSLQFLKEEQNLCITLKNKQSKTDIESNKKAYHPHKPLIIKELKENTQHKYEDIFDDNNLGQVSEGGCLHITTENLKLNSANSFKSKISSYDMSRKMDGTIKLLRLGNESFTNSSSEISQINEGNLCSFNSNTSLKDVECIMNNNDLCDSNVQSITYKQYVDKTIPDDPIACKYIENDDSIIISIQPLTKNSTDLSSISDSVIPHYLFGNDKSTLNIKVTSNNNACIKTESLLKDLELSTEDESDDDYMRPRIINGFGIPFLPYFHDSNNSSDENISTSYKTNEHLMMKNESCQTICQNFKETLNLAYFNKLDMDINEDVTLISDKLIKDGLLQKTERRMPVLPIEKVSNNLRSITSNLKERLICSGCVERTPNINHSNKIKKKNKNSKNKKHINYSSRNKSKTVLNCKTPRQCSPTFPIKTDYKKKIQALINERCTKTANTLKIHSARDFINKKHKYTDKKMQRIKIKKLASGMDTDNRTNTVISQKFETIMKYNKQIEIQKEKKEKDMTNDNIWNLKEDSTYSPSDLRKRLTNEIEHLYPIKNKSNTNQGLIMSKKRSPVKYQSTEINLKHIINSLSERTQKCHFNNVLDPILKSKTQFSYPNQNKINTRMNVMNHLNSNELLNIISTTESKNVFKEMSCALECNETKDKIIEKSLKRNKGITDDWDSKLRHLTKVTKHKNINSITKGKSKNNLKQIIINNHMETNKMIADRININSSMSENVDTFSRREESSSYKSEEKSKCYSKVESLGNINKKYTESMCDQIEKTENFEENYHKKFMSCNSQSANSKYTPKFKKIEDNNCEFDTQSFPDELKSLPMIVEDQDEYGKVVNQVSFPQKTQNISTKNNKKNIIEENILLRNIKRTGNTCNSQHLKILVTKPVIRVSIPTNLINQPILKKCLKRTIDEVYLDSKPVCKGGDIRTESVTVKQAPFTPSQNRHCINSKYQDEFEKEFDKCIKKSKTINKSSGFQRVNQNKQLKKTPNNVNNKIIKNFKEQKLHSNQENSIVENDKSWGSDERRPKKRSMATSHDITVPKKLQSSNYFHYSQEKLPLNSNVTANFSDLNNSLQSNFLETSVNERKYITASNVSKGHCLNNSEDLMSQSSVKKPQITSEPVHLVLDIHQRQEKMCNTTKTYLVQAHNTFNFNETANTESEIQQEIIDNKSTVYAENNLPIIPMSIPNSIYNKNCAKLKNSLSLDESKHLNTHSLQSGIRRCTSAPVDTLNHLPLSSSYNINTSRSSLLNLEQSSEQKLNSKPFVQLQSYVKRQSSEYNILGIHKSALPEQVGSKIKHMNLQSSQDILKDGFTEKTGDIIFEANNKDSLKSITNVDVNMPSKQEMSIRVKHPSLLTSAHIDDFTEGTQHIFEKHVLNISNKEKKQWTWYRTPESGHENKCKDQQIRDLSIIILEKEQDKRKQFFTIFKSTLIKGSNELGRLYDIIDCVELDHKLKEDVIISVKKLLSQDVIELEINRAIQEFENKLVEREQVFHETFTDLMRYFMVKRFRYPVVISIYICLSKKVTYICNEKKLLKEYLFSLLKKWLFIDEFKKNEIYFVNDCAVMKKVFDENCSDDLIDFNLSNKTSNSNKATALPKESCSVFSNQDTLSQSNKIVLSSTLVAHESNEIPAENHPQSTKLYSITPSIISLSTETSSILQSLSANGKHTGLHNINQFEGIKIHNNGLQLVPDPLTICKCDQDLITPLKNSFSQPNSLQTSNLTFASQKNISSNSVSQGYNYFQLNNDNNVNSNKKTTYKDTIGIHTNDNITIQNPTEEYNGNCNSLNLNTSDYRKQKIFNYFHTSEVTSTFQNRRAGNSISQGYKKNHSSHIASLASGQTVSLLNTCGNSMSMNSKRSQPIENPDDTNTALSTMDSVLENGIIQTEVPMNVNPPNFDQYHVPPPERQKSDQLQNSKFLPVVPISSTTKANGYSGHQKICLTDLGSTESSCTADSSTSINSTAPNKYQYQNKINQSLNIFEINSSCNKTMYTVKKPMDTSCKIQNLIPAQSNIMSRAQTIHQEASPATLGYTSTHNVIDQVDLMVPISEVSTAQTGNILNPLFQHQLITSDFNINSERKYEGNIGSPFESVVHPVCKPFINTTFSNRMQKKVEQEQTNSRFHNKLSCNMQNKTGLIQYGDKTPSNNMVSGMFDGQTIKPLLSNTVNRIVPTKPNINSQSMNNQMSPFYLSEKIIQDQNKTSLMEFQNGNIDTGYEHHSINKFPQTRIQIFNNLQKGCIASNLISQLGKNVNQSLQQSSDLSENNANEYCISKKYSCHKRFLDQSIHLRYNQDSIPNTLIPTYQGNNHKDFYQEIHNYQHTCNFYKQMNNSFPQGVPHQTKHKIDLEGYSDNILDLSDVNEIPPEDFERLQNIISDDEIISLFYGDETEKGNPNPENISTNLAISQTCNVRNSLEMSHSNLEKKITSERYNVVPTRIAENFSHFNQPKCFVQNLGQSSHELSNIYRSNIQPLMCQRTVSLKESVFNTLLNIQYMKENLIINQLENVIHFNNVNLTNKQLFDFLTLFENQIKKYGLIHDLETSFVGPFIASDGRMFTQEELFALSKGVLTIQQPHQMQNTRNAVIPQHLMQQSLENKILIQPKSISLPQYSLNYGNSTSVETHPGSEMSARETAINDMKRQIIQDISKGLKSFHFLNKQAVNDDIGKRAVNDVNFFIGK